MYCAIIECTAIGLAANPTIRLMPEVAARSAWESDYGVCTAYDRCTWSAVTYVTVPLYHLSLFFLPPSPLYLPIHPSLFLFSPPLSSLVSWSRPLVSPLRSPQVVRDRSALLRSRPCVNTRLPEIDDPSRSFICDPDSPPCVVYVCARARMPVCVCARLLLQSAYNNDPLRSTHVSHLDGRISGARLSRRGGAVRV